METWIFVVIAGSNRCKHLKRCSKVYIFFLQKEKRNILNYLFYCILLSKFIFVLWVLDNKTCIVHVASFFFTGKFLWSNLQICKTFVAYIFVSFSKEKLWPLLVAHELWKKKHQKKKKENIIVDSKIFRWWCNISFTYSLVEFELPS